MMSGPTVATRVHSRPCSVPGTSHSYSSGSSNSPFNPCFLSPALLASISAGEPMCVRILCSAMSAFWSPVFSVHLGWRGEEGIARGLHSMCACAAFTSSDRTICNTCLFIAAPRSQFERETFVGFLR